MKKKNVSNPTLLNKSFMELYIGSLFVMALQDSEKKDFWIGKSKEDPPDMVFMTVTYDDNKRAIFQAREIEITRYLKKDKSLIDVILNKDNVSLKDYIIVCFLEFNGYEDLKTLSENLKKKLKNIYHVFLIFNGLPFADLNQPPTLEEIKGKVSLVQLSPTFIPAHIFDIKEGLDKWKLDINKLVYVENAKVYSHLRDGDTMTPKIINDK